ncbi:ORF6C domain-containing protein [Actinobacillus sp. GY-402]|nr:ORF6C domain-containing protein [Actinobacillus sp. GY-402]
MELSITREDMGIRLVEERTRLGYSQANFAHQTEINRETLRLNETGRTGISAEFLGRAAQLGVDVQYVITGIRSNSDIETKIMTPPTQSVQGDKNNVVYDNKGIVNSGTINNITTEKHVTRTKAVIEPDDKHINETMARTLQDLVKEIVETEKQIKKAPKSFQAVWASLNKHCGVVTYRQIPKESYAKAETYLRKWLGRLTSAKSAPKKLGNPWRNKKYAYIHTNVKQFNLELWLRAYIQDRYAAESLTELDDEQLQKVYLAVSSKKRTASK